MFTYIFFSLIRCATDMYVCMYVSVVNAFFLCLLDPMYISRVPGVAFKNKIPFIELKEFELQRSASTDAQRRFYQVIILTRRKRLHPVDVSINSIRSAIDISLCVLSCHRKQGLRSAYFLLSRIINQGVSFPLQPCDHE